MTESLVHQDGCVSLAPSSVCKTSPAWHQLRACDIEVTQVGQEYKPRAGCKYYNRFNIRGTRISGGRTLRGAHSMPDMRAWRSTSTRQKSINAVLTHQCSVFLVDGVVGPPSAFADGEWRGLGTDLNLGAEVVGALTRKVCLPEGYSQLQLLPVSHVKQLLGLLPVQGVANGSHHVIDPGAL